MEVVRIEETDADEVIHQTLCVVDERYDLVVQVENNEGGREFIEKNFWHFLDDESIQLIVNQEGE